MFMKTLALTCLTAAILFGGVAAQNDPYGQPDTLYLDQITAPPGQECVIAVNLWNDEELGGVTIPLMYPKDKLDFIDLDFSGGRIDYINTKPVTVDTAAGTILVGAIVFLEAFISTGDGMLFSLRFRVKDGLVPGEVMTIDSTTIPPAYLVLSHTTATNIYPVFRAGTITVAEENRPPYFTPIPDQYIAEGESLVVDIEAFDPEGDPVTIANPIHPKTSEFTDNGDGTGRFTWCPDFIGPESSDMSPFEFVFWASDGDVASYITVAVHVINVNRKPQIVAPGQIEAEAGDSLAISISCVDPDFEAITWSIDGLPPGATFDYENPGLISWASEFEDSGQYPVTVTATDPHGLADTAELVIDLAAVTLYSLRIDTITTFSGRIVDIEVHLKNRSEIGQFRLLLNLDPLLLSPLGVSFMDTRAEDFEYLDYRINNTGIQGDLLITGKADIQGGPDTPPISEGEGAICRISVQVTPNLIYVGSQVPIRFINRFSDDNTLKRADGVTITRDQIKYFDGYVLIASPGPVLLGDINLNGLAFEISDAVYFSNFFISPTLYPLNEQQLLNSDINQDGMAPSVADLVLMIEIVSGSKPPPAPKILPRPDIADVALLRDNTGLYVTVGAPVGLGGALFRLRGPDIDELQVSNLTAMDLQAATWHDQLSCLLISYDGKSISSGDRSVIKLADDPSLDIALEYADLADTEGRALQINKKETAAVPDRFLLHQNIPNPFNPSTEIRFDLHAPARVTLTVYNILGEEIIRLIDAEYPAGTHAVIWDGVDENGQPAASGIYLYRIVAGAVSASRKMVLLK